MSEFEIFLWLLASMSAPVFPAYKLGQITERNKRKKQND